LKKVVVPATTANLGPGFDCIGMCLGLFNTVRYEIGGESTHIRYDGFGAEDLPTDGNNLIIKAIDYAMAHAGKKRMPVNIDATNGIPPARGLGSSAAAIVAGLMIGNDFCDGCYSQDDLFMMACEIEGHPDNIAPAIYGGLCLSYKTSSRFQVKKILPASNIEIVVAYPHYKASTRAARKNLPLAVSMTDAIHSTVRVGLLVSGIIDNDASVLKVAMDDRLHQPYRFPMLPGVENALAAAMSAGSHFAVLSGSGPSVLAFVSNTCAENVGLAMVDAFKRAGESAEYFMTRPRNNGAEIL
jgi:homoserine kinase